MDTVIQRHIVLLAMKGLADDAVALGGEHADEQFIATAIEAGLGMIYGDQPESGVMLLKAMQTRYPDCHLVCHALGTGLSFRGDYAEALGYQQLAVTAETDNPLYRYNYAFTLEKTGAVHKAEEQYCLTWRSCPDYAKAAIGYARMLVLRHSYLCAVKVLREALACCAEDQKLLFALANSLTYIGEPERALLYFQIAYTLAPDDQKIADNFLYALLMVQELSAHVVADELEQLSSSPQLLRLMLQAVKRLSTLDAALVVDYHRAVGKRMEARSGKQETVPQAVPAVGARRLKIGYLSSDMYSHPIGYLLEGVLQQHDHSRFEVVAFSPFAERDALTERLKQSCDRWIVMDPVDREQSYRRIVAEELDILVELAGHTGDSWLDLCARRAAPIQMTWCGYPATTGLSEMDYIIADYVALPEDEEQYYSEKVLRIPNSYASLLPPQDAPSVAPLPALEKGYLTFGAILTIHKLSCATITLWSQVLQAVPEARLLLKAKTFSDPDVCSLIRARFAAEGVKPERIDLEGGSPRFDMLGTYHRIDIALDPVPYQGGVTILDAFWMGVPTLLRKGNRAPFIRHGENYLVQMQLADWIANTEAEFVATAVARSLDLPALAALRACMRERIAASPLCDTSGFTRGLEVAFEHAWREYRASHGERLLLRKMARSDLQVTSVKRCASACRTVTGLI